MSSEIDQTIESETAPLKAWIEPEVRELEISRTANNPTVGSDGGVGDCSFP